MCEFFLGGGAILVLHTVGVIESSLVHGLLFFCVAADKTIKISAKRRRFYYVLYRFVCLTVLFTYFVSLSLVSLSLLYKCHLLIKCFIISPFFRSITCAFVSVPSRLPHMAPFCWIFSFLCLMFFFLFQPPASGEISQSLLDLCLLNFEFVLFFL